MRFFTLLASLLVLITPSVMAYTQPPVPVGSEIAVELAPLNVREAPTLEAATLGTQNEQVRGVIVSDPHWADGYWWFEIDYESGPDGWSAYGSQEAVFISVVKPDSTAITAPETTVDVAPTNDQYRYIFKDGSRFKYNWVKNLEGDCEGYVHILSYSAESQRIDWTGECVDGKISGSGDITLIKYEPGHYSDGIELFYFNASEKTGVIFEEGYPTGIISPNEVELFPYCGDGDGTSQAAVVVPRNVNLNYPEVGQALLQYAGEHLVSLCPKERKFGSIFLEVYYTDTFEGVPEGGFGVGGNKTPFTGNQGNKFIQARNYDEDQLTWKELENYASRNLYKTLRENILLREAGRREDYEAEQLRLAEERQRAEEAAREAQIRAEEAARRAELEAIEATANSFLEENRVDLKAGLEAIYANPFQYEGQTVVFLAKFLQMTERDRALLESPWGNHQFVLFDIPDGTFTRSEVVALVGSVRGNEEVNLGTSVGLVPSVRFESIMYCEQFDEGVCNQFIP